MNYYDKSEFFLDDDDALWNKKNVNDPVEQFLIDIANMHFSEDETQNYLAINQLKGRAKDLLRRHNR